MRQAISTKFLGPTATRGPRVRASAGPGSVTLDWDDALDGPQNHRAAARALAEKLAWYGSWYGGALAGGGYVFVCDGYDGDADGFYITDLRNARRTP